MHPIHFYKDGNGKEPVKDFISVLAARNDKDSRIKLNKIRDYIRALSEYGTQLGEPYVKHLDGEIWELRPIRNRILFAAWDGDGFLLLHQFIKRTQKTPRQEIAKAKRNLADYQERSQGNEN